MPDTLSSKIVIDNSQVKAQADITLAQFKNIQASIRAMSREAASSSIAGPINPQLIALEQQSGATEARLKSLKSQLASTTSSGGFVAQLSSARAALGGIGSALGAIGIGVGIGALIEGLKHLVTGTEEFGLQTSKMAAQLGISENHAASLGLALRGIGSSTDEYASLVMHLEQRLRAQESAWHGYGMATRNASHELLSGQALMDSAISTMQTYKAGTDQNEFAVQVFGRSAKDMYDVIRANSSAQKEAADILKDFGVTTDGAGDSAARLEGALSRETMEWLALELAVGQKLEPTITSFINWAGSSGEPVLQGLADVLKVLASAGIVVGTVFDEAGRIISLVLVPAIEAVTGAAHVAADVFRGDFDAAIADSKRTVHEMGTTFHDVAHDMVGDAKAAVAAIEGMFSAEQTKPGANPFAQSSGNRNFVPVDTSAKKSAAYGVDPDMMAQVKAELDQLRQMDASDSETSVRLAQIALDQKKQIWGEEVAAGRMTKEQEAQLESSAAKEILAAQLAAQDNYIKMLQAGTVEFEKAENARKIIAAQGAAEIAGYQRQQADAAKQAAAEAAKGWEDANRVVLSAENQLVSGIFSGHQKLGQLLASVARETAQKEIEADLGWATQRMLLTAEVGTAQQASEKGGLLANLLFNQQQTAAVVHGQAQETAAVAAGTTAQTAIKSAGAGSSNAVEAAANSKSILGAAYTSAAEAYKSVMQSVPPPVNMFLAPVAAAGTFAAVAAYNVVSAEGGEWNVAGNEVPYVLHREEAVMPPRVAAPMREFFERGAAGAFSQGGDTYHQNFHIANGVNFESLRNDHSARRAFMSELKNAMRNAGRRVR